LDKIVTAVTDFFTLKRPIDVVKRTVLRVVVWQLLFMIPLPFVPEHFRPAALALAVKLVALLALMHVAADAVKLGRIRWASQKPTSE